MQIGVISEDKVRVRRRTPAVVVGVLLLIIIRAQDLFILIWKQRVCLAGLGATSTTVRLQSVFVGGGKMKEKRVKAG